ncbi:MAG TPA: hypothetical protein DCK76_07160 [Desulfotomaculum sp.]|nr:MAG: hypothetical protein XD84_0756 [Desulfotomaculum sp. 46_80]KUK85240.1 MAG: hypothetical protein XE00_0183 [Desulfofundulus kuznetsovii]HAG11146.1 hypothetical protein [Desulfotomaculum sp.]HBY03256.1 hypothetical protein [Desulfotomaculum sp.]
MYPQTHVFFAHKLFGFLSDALVLGSIFPDIAAGLYNDRNESHGRGVDMLLFLQEIGELNEFVMGVITHGIDPKGLDYYGDERFLSYERGYCFEKGRLIVDETIEACNLPASMGWWKSHNIIEMGIELYINNSFCSTALESAFANEVMVLEVSKYMSRFYATEPNKFQNRIQNFFNYIEISKISAESLAARYDMQMYTRHRIHIDVPRVTGLIFKAVELIADDFNDFFNLALDNVRKSLSELQA